MKKTSLILFLTVVFLLNSIQQPLFSETSIPTTISAPEHFGVMPYIVDSFIYTISAPEDMRQLIEAGTMPNYVKTQMDYKMDSGEWHYTSAWDSAGITLKNTFSFTFGKGTAYVAHGREKLSTFFPDDLAVLEPVINRSNSWDFFTGHTFSFRARFVVSFDNNKTFIYSPWSTTYVLSDSVVLNPNTLMNHAPTLTTATIEKNSGGQPFLNIRTGRLPDETQDMNSAVGDGVFTEIWMRKSGETDFKMINTSFFANEFILVGVSDYFGKAQPSYASEQYEIKIRYGVDLRKYPQANRSDTIYSPYSNIFSQNMPAWTNAHPWALAELQDASDAGLIPDILKSKDLTQPITREEFGELAVLLYENVTGKASVAVSPNPFTDTNNPQILKAYSLGITTGTSPTLFSPNLLINREQCAAMLYRDIQAIVPEGDFTVATVADFADQKYISAYAVAAAKYMSHSGIIKGDAKGNFMPKGNTPAEKAANYGMATREQAIIMSYRIYDIYK